MGKLYYKLLVLACHYFTAFAHCNVTAYYKEEIMYDRCPQENYYCDDYDRQNKQIYSFTCNFTEMWEIHDSLEMYETGHITYIVLKDTNIPTLSPEGYSWKYVRRLQIEETNTSEIIPGFFDNFDDLRELLIVKNKITTISDGDLSSMFLLYTLNLSENLIEIVEPYSFSGLFNLRELDLSKNKITNLPEDIFHYQKYLIYVDISNNMLKSIGTIFKGHSLETINLFNNFLSEFDFNQLQSSEYSKIDLSNNKIDNVTGLVNVVYIEDISLACNKISILPKLNNIQKFNISYNRIQSIAENELSGILQSLDLNGNNISVLTNYVFTNLANLEYLYLAHNNLSLLQINALHNLHNLIHLDLSFNRIRQIPFGIFNDLSNLTYLDLSDNNMVLDFHTLSTLESLQTIKFANNKVQNFDSDILLSRFKSLISITLSDNSWNCSELASIIHKLQLNNKDITPGQNRNVSNILGISCKDNTDLKEDTIIIERNNEASKDVGFYPSAEKIDNTLRNSSFFKYLQTIAQHIADNKSLDTISRNENNTNFSKFMENFKIYAANMQEYNNKSMRYLGEIFNNTNFFKYYLNSSKSSIKTDFTNSSKLQSDLFEIFNQTIPHFTRNIISWQNKTFSEISNNVKQSLLMPKNIGWSEMNQTLINFTNSFNEISNNIKQISNLNSLPTNSKLESKALESEKYEEIKASLIFINIFLAMILCCLVFSAFRKFFKGKTINNVTREQVQLM